MDSATAEVVLLPTMDRIEKLCVEKGMRMTEQRRVIARVVSSPVMTIPMLKNCTAARRRSTPGISIATVYRTVRLFEESGHSRAP